MFDNKVILRPEDHRYFHIDTGVEYTSVSKVLESLKTPFDTEGMSFGTARKQLKQEGVLTPTDRQLSERQKIVKAQWKQTNKNSTDHGTRIHDSLEHYGRTTQIKEPDLEAMIRAVYARSAHYKKFWMEQVVHHDDSRTAGTSDKLYLRPKTSNVIDVEDYKTNLSKGIQEYSPYGNRLKAPFEHLEDCDFVTYTLQLSIYAAIIELQYGYKIGSLTMTYIPPDSPLSFRCYPIAYLRCEAFYLLKKQQSYGAISNGPALQKGVLSGVDS